MCSTLFACIGRYIWHDSRLTVSRWTVRLSVNSLVITQRERLWNDDSIPETWRRLCGLEKVLEETTVGDRWTERFAFNPISDWIISKIGLLGLQSNRPPAVVPLAKVLLFSTSVAKTVTRIVKNWKYIRSYQLTTCTSTYESSCYVNNIRLARLAPYYRTACESFLASSSIIMLELCITVGLRLLTCCVFMYR